MINVTLPSGLTLIGNNAFENCTSLGTLELPSSLSTLGESAFSGCSDLKISGLENTGISEFNANTFYNCSSLGTDITFPELYGGDTAVTIDSSAFSGCTGLQNIYLSKSVHNIKDSTFATCSGLKNIYVYYRNCTVGSTIVPTNEGMYI